MAIPNLAPNYLGQVKGIRAQREENERQRAFERQQASSNFLRTLGRDVLGTALNIGQDVAGTAFRDYLEAPERLSKQGVSTYDDSDFGEQAQAIRKAAEARATAELRPEASFGEAAETGMGRRGIDLGPVTLGGAKAAPLQAKPAAPSPPPTPRASNSMLTPGLESLFQRVVSRPVVPAAPRGMASDAGRRPVEPMQMRGMESEAPRRPLPAPQSAPMAQPRPMPGRETREAPGGYAAPRITLPERSAMAGEAGVREAMPFMSPKARGLEQQASDVREERRLKLALLQRQSDAAAEQVEELKAKGAGHNVIAQATKLAKEAEARKNLAMEADYLAGAQRKSWEPVTYKGRIVAQPGQRFTPKGSTQDGLGGSFGPADALPAAPSGGGRGGARGQGDEPTGDVLTLVVQTRDRKGNPVGPSQPRRIQESPALWRSVATAPVDYGMNATQAAQYKEAFRAFNAALPAARKGDAAALEAAMKAQSEMRAQLLAGQGSYAPDVAATREGFGTSPKDTATEQLRQEMAQFRQQLDQQRETAGRTRRVGNLYQEIAPLADPAKVTADDIAAAVMDSGAALPGSKGRFVTSDGAELDRDAFEAAMRGLPMPASVDGEDVAAYRRLSDEAKKARDQLTTGREKLRARRIEALALQMEAEGDADPLTTMEQSGVVLPAELKAKKARTVILPPAAPPARPQPPAQPAARPTAPAAQTGTPRFTSLDAAAEWVARQPITPEQKSALLEKLEDEQGLQ